MADYRVIAGFENYRVGDDGTVWCNLKLGRKWIGSNTGEWRQLKPHVNKSGHKTVELGRGNRRYVHRLILEAFVGPCPEGMECLHRNGDPGLNVLSNLRWGTPKDNRQDSINHGTAYFTPGNVPCVQILNEEQVKQIVTMHEGGRPLNEIATIFQTHETNIHSIVTGRSWSHVTGIKYSPKSSWRKGQQRRILSDEDVLEIHRLHWQENIKSGKIAMQFKVSDAAVRMILSGRRRPLKPTEPEN